MENPTQETEAAFESTYYYKAELNASGSWKHALSIAPGVYDQYGHMNTTGHTYMVMEPAIDGHYELEATPTHPMLNGLTHNENDPNTIKDMVDVYDYDLASLVVTNSDSYPPTYEQDAQNSSVYSVANTLKAGINIRKELVGLTEAQQLAFRDEYFTVKVTLEKNGSPVFDAVDGGGAVGYRIYAPAAIPDGATVTPEGAEGDAVTSYRINDITYTKNNDGTSGFTARGPIGTDGTVTLKIRECDSLRIVNVPMGTNYTVEEVEADIPSQFSYKETYWEVKKNDTIYDNKSDTVTDNVINETIVPDAENNVVVRNKTNPGALKITKVVVDETDSTGTYIDGNYVFKVSSKMTITSGGSTIPAVVKYVMITVNSGNVVSYRIADTADALETTDAQEVTENDRFALVSDLLEGDYDIEEVNKNGLMLTGMSRGDNSTEAVNEDDGIVTVHVTAGDINAGETSAQATFTNTYYNNDGPDKIALDIVKTFSGILSLSEVPDSTNGFEVVVGYTLDGQEKTITLKKEENETNLDGIKIVSTTNGLSISWHITSIPTEAKDFKIKEVNYDGVPGYDFITAVLDGADITDTAGEWHDMSVIAPTATLSNVTTERHTPDSETNLRYEIQDADILLSKLTANEGTLIISKTSLNTIEREAVMKGWPKQGGFKKPGIFFSIEDHPDGFSFGNKTIKFSEKDGKTYVTFTSNVAAQEAVFAVSYDSHAELNNASLTNTYTRATLDIVKVKANDPNTKLPGAQFTIRKIKDTLGANDIQYDGEESEPVITGEDGDARFEGITKGYYEIKETKAPDGYGFIGDNCFSIKVENGVISLLEKDLTKNPSEWDATKTMVENVTFTAASDTDDAKVQVENSPGAILPSTGGPGTNALYNLGTLLIALAGAGLLHMKRRKA